MKFPFMQKRKPCAGFTLIELLVVMGVILILAGIVVGVQRGVYQQQSQARAKADMQTIANALETFKQKYGDYPWLGDDSSAKANTDVPKKLFDVLTGENILRYDSGSKKYVMGGPSGTATPLIDESLIETDDDSDPEYFVDPWGNPYRYFYLTESEGQSLKDNPKSVEWNSPSFILISYGPDGEVVSVSDLGKGTLPASAEDYYDNPSDADFDNLIYGYENQ